MRPISILYFGIALLAPVFFFATTLMNETHPLLPWIVCPLLFAAAATLAAVPAQRTFRDPTFTKLFAWSVFIGLVEALMFTVV